MFLTYTFNMIFSFEMSKKTNNKNDNNSSAVMLGITMGVLNFFGFYFLLSALKIGQLSLIFVIQSMSLLFPIVLSVIIYKEKTTARRLFGVILAIVALILIKG